MSRLMAFYGLFFFFAIFTLSAGRRQDYCNICSDHTMCLYTNKTPVCNAIKFKLKKKDQDLIVNLHNKLRQNVASGNERRGNPGPQPPAEYMPDLSTKRTCYFNSKIPDSIGPSRMKFEEEKGEVWDKELARIAQRWVNTCNIGHDKCRNIRRTDEIEFIGQNFNYKGTTGPEPFTITDLVNEWYDEVKFFDSHQVENIQNVSGVGHYIQMLWAKTTRIGCGYLHWMEQNDNNVLLVCNYGPGGNQFGYKMYEIRR